MEKSTTIAELFREISASGDKEIEKILKKIKKGC